MPRYGHTPVVYTPAHVRINGISSLFNRNSFISSGPVPLRSRRPPSTIQLRGKFASIRPSPRHLCPLTQGTGPSRNTRILSQNLALSLRTGKCFVFVDLFLSMPFPDCFLPSDPVSPVENGILFPKCHKPWYYSRIDSMGSGIVVPGGGLVGASGDGIPVFY